MSIHEIIRKINTDKHEIAYFKWKMRGVVLGVVLVMLGEIVLGVWVWLLWR